MNNAQNNNDMNLQINETIRFSDYRNAIAFLCNNGLPNICPAKLSQAMNDAPNGCVRVGDYFISRHAYSFDMMIKRVK